jgi:hypothetical protein
MNRFEGYNAQKEELYEIKQDLVEQQSRGVSTLHFDNAAAKARVRYKDLLLECDVYTAGDSTTVVLFCPRCKQQLRVDSSRKSIEWDPAKGLLSIEPFQCTWELPDEHLGAKRDFGFSLCRLTIAIDKGIAKDA